MENNISSACSWMSKIDGTKKITEFNIPGTHDSCTKHVTFFPISNTQSLDITEQLNIGVRYFDMRAARKNGEYITCHSIATCYIYGGLSRKPLTLFDVIRSMYDFLEKNPTETILFCLKEDRGNSGDEFYSFFYDLYIKDNTDKWYTENRVPTLDEVRGKIVLILRAGHNKVLFDDKMSGISFAKYYAKANRSDTESQRTDIENNDGERLCGIFIQDGFNLSAKKKITAIGKFRQEEKSKNDFNILTTCTCSSLFPIINANQVNKFLMANPIKKGEYVGVCSIDFAEEKIVEMIYSSNFE